MAQQASMDRAAQSSALLPAGSLPANPSPIEREGSVGTHRGPWGEAWNLLAMLHFQCYTLEVSDLTCWGAAFEQSPALRC